MDGRITRVKILTPYQYTLQTFGINKTFNFKLFARLLSFNAPTYRTTQPKWSMTFMLTMNAGDIQVWSSTHHIIKFYLIFDRILH